MLAGLNDRQWLMCASGFYLAALLLGIAALVQTKRAAGTRTYALVCAGYLLQCIGLGIRGHLDGGCPLGNRFEISQFTAWSAITLYLLVGVIFRASILGAFTAFAAAAITLVSLAIPSWDSTRRTHIFGANPWIELHAALATFSYGVFALLALTSLMFLFRHYSLKSKRTGGWFSLVPSIIELDHIEVRLLSAGVILLAVALAVGSVYWLREPQTAGAVKVVATVAVWAAYATALGLRLGRLLLAKRFAWVCLALLAGALLSLGPVDSSRHSVSAVTDTGQK